MSEAYVMEQLFQDINWNDIKTAVQRRIYQEEKKQANPDIIRNQIQNALNEFALVEDLKVLTLKYLIHLDDVLLKKFTLNSKKTLRVLDVTGSVQLTGSGLKLVLKQCEVLDELCLNELPWTSFDGISNLKYLRKLTMNQCTNLTRIHLKHLPKLEHISLEECTSLRKVSISSLSKEKPYANLSHLSFIGDNSLSFSSFSQLFKGLKDNGYKICHSFTHMNRERTNSEEKSGICCIKIDECLGLYSSASAKSNSETAAFIKEAMVPEL